MPLNASESSAFAVAKHSTIATMHKSSHREIRPQPDRTFNDIQTQALPSSSLESSLNSNDSSRTQIKLYQAHTSKNDSNLSCHNSLRLRDSTESSNNESLDDLRSKEQSRTECQRAPQRRSHTKSRTGCFTCKDRRIKVLYS
jgi:hypothetical protein